MRLHEYMCTCVHVVIWLLICSWNHQNEIVLCLSCAWVDFHRGTNHRNVLMLLEILFLCLCKVAGNHVLVLGQEPWDGKSKVRHFFCTRGPQHARLWTYHINPLSCPWSSPWKQDTSSLSEDLGTAVSVMFSRCHAHKSPPLPCSMPLSSLPVCQVWHLCY